MISSNVLRWAKKRMAALLPARKPALEFVAEGWNRAVRDASVRGWDVESVPQAQVANLNSWQSMTRGPTPFGNGDAALHNTLASFAYVVALAARNVERMSMLDWGGGVGQYGLLARELVPGVAVDYCCREVPVQCAWGRKLGIPATYFEADDEFAGRQFDLVFASGALHYAQDWEAVLRNLFAATKSYVFVTRMPVVLEGPSYVVLQRASQYGYGTEYLGWRLNRDEFLAAARRLGGELLREFVVDGDEWARGAPTPAHGRGFLFRVNVRLAF